MLTVNTLLLDSGHEGAGRDLGPEGFAVAGIRDPISYRDPLKA